MTTRYVIVGAGLAGHQAALELRRAAPVATITLVGSEGGLPYDRTSLSKSVLLQNEPDLAELELPGARQYSELGIDHRPGLTVSAIDRASRTVVTTEGIGFNYDKLLLATGSRPRRLFQGESVDGAYLRILEESLALRRAIARRGKIVVVGGGFIGLETAAAARSSGCAVTVIEASTRLLARGMPHFLSNWTLGLHRSHGVRFVFGAAVDELHEAGGAWLVSAGGEKFDADVVLVGIGVVPNVELAAAAGLAVSDGIVVDAFCRTEDTNIFAAGEATAHPNSPDGTLRRVESWKTAMDHGIAAARNMSGISTPFTNIPWFWSDQYEQNIQSVGFPAEGTQFMMVEGATAAAWTLVALDRHGTTVGAVAANRGRDISILKRTMQAKSMIPASMRLVEITAEEWTA